MILEQANGSQISYRKTFNHFEVFDIGNGQVACPVLLLASV